MKYTLLVILFLTGCRNKAAEYHVSLAPIALLLRHETEYDVPPQEKPAFSSYVAPSANQLLVMIQSDDLTKRVVRNKAWRSYLAPCLREMGVPKDSSDEVLIRAINTRKKIMAINSLGFDITISFEGLSTQSVRTLSELYILALRSYKYE